MTDDQHQNDELKMDASFISSLECATNTWYEARHRLQNEPTTLHQDAYCKATDELGQAFSRWQREQPELVEQLRLRFTAHPDD